MRQSIRQKFTLWYIGSFVILLLLSFGLTEAIFQKFALKSIDDSLYDATQRLQQSLSDCFPVEQHQAHDGFHDCFNRQIRELFATEIVFAQIMSFLADQQGSHKILAQTYTLAQQSFPFSPAAQQAILEGSPLFETIKGGIFGSEGRLLTIAIHAQDRQPYILQFGIRTGEKQTSLSIPRHPLTSRPHIFFVVFPLLLIAAIVWGYFFMKRVFAPIHRLAVLAKQITAEDLALRIEDVKSDDEIGELAETFNEMIARLERSFKQIQQFSGDVSHELKTPLTVIKGELEVALRKERTGPEYQKILTSFLEETDKLGKIVEDLLFLSRMDAHAIPLAFTTLQLDEILLNVYEDICRLVQEKQMTVNLKQIDQISILGDPVYLKIALTNLLLNAVKYTPAGGKVELALEKKADTAICTITDTGVGIPEDALPYIFDRFYRVDQSRSHDTGGSGLGLAIVQKIIEAHQGTITVSSQPGKGSIFQVLLASSV